MTTAFDPESWRASTIARTRAAIAMYREWEARYLLHPDNPTWDYGAFGWATGHAWCEIAGHMAVVTWLEQLTPDALATLIGEVAVERTEWPASMNRVYLAGRHTNDAAWLAYVKEHQ